jgi:hypothetical protein
VDKNSTAYPRRFRARNVRIVSKLEPAKSEMTGALSKDASCEHSISYWPSEHILVDFVLTAGFSP